MPYYRAGRQSDALDSYEELRAQLAEELGLGPSAMATPPNCWGRPPLPARRALPLAPAERADLDRITARTRAALGEDAFAARFERGGTLALDEARSLAELSSSDKSRA